MSGLEEGIYHGRESSQVYQPEWHPERCQCGECHLTRLQQEEQQVLSQFEAEINRLEDDVRRNAEFSSTSRRYIDDECLLGKQQTSDYTQKLFKGFPAREEEVAEDQGRRRGRNPRPSDPRDEDGGRGPRPSEPRDEDGGRGPRPRYGCHASDQNQNAVPENPRVGTPHSSTSSVRRRYIINDYDGYDEDEESWKLERQGDYGWVGEEATETLDVGADDQHLHNGYGRLVEADDPGCWGTHHRRRHRPSHARHSQSSEYGLSRQHSVDSQREQSSDGLYGRSRQQSVDSQTKQSSDSQYGLSRQHSVDSQRELRSDGRYGLSRQHSVYSQTEQSSDGQYGRSRQQSVDSQTEQSSDGLYGLSRQQSVDSQTEAQRFSAKNETVFKEAARAKNKRSLTLRIKDTIRRRYRVA